jgi:membrane protein implicated in regulation of membrane protease activity
MALLSGCRHQTKGAFERSGGQVCHVVLLLPVLGLALFWVWPFWVAAPAYGVILLVSALTYRAVVTAMQGRVVTGREGLLHQVGEVTSASDDGWLVHVHGELWRATSPDVLKTMDLVEVTGVQGLTLQVRKTRLS